MEPTTMFWMFVLFAVIGFITEIIWDFNIYTFYSAIGTIIFGVSVIFIVMNVTNAQADPTSAIEKIVNLFVNFLVPAIIGEAAGLFVGGFFKPFLDR